MKILFAASECVPFAKTGGLADVVGSLPYALASLASGASGEKFSFCVVLPKYGVISTNQFPMERLPGALNIPMKGHVETGSAWRLKGNIPGFKIPKNISFYFIDHPNYYNRSGIYGSAGSDYPDNDARYIFFSRAVLELAKLIDFKPDVIHCHDWQTGLIPVYLKTIYKIDSFFSTSASVFTIHNIAYQGAFHRATLDVAGLPHSEFTPQKLEYYGHVNFLKGALVYADYLTTVSPTYAQEIHSSSWYGRGMEGVLSHRKENLVGILNGLNEAEWNPSKDEWICKSYSVKAKDFWARKRACKLDLQKSLGLPENPDIPVIGMVSRLDLQKGFQFVLELIPWLDLRGIEVQWAIQGLGDPALQSRLEMIQKRHPHFVAFHGQFDNSMAHKIYAGSDLFSMPSLFEPCGLSQMISMRYGTVPVVTPTGGLKDTVIPFDSSSEEGTGFVASAVTAPSYCEAMGRALKVYEQSDLWRKCVKNAMAQDFSWTHPAKDYVRLYDSTRGKMSV